MEFKGTKGKWNRVKLEKTDFYTERNEIHYGVDGECVAEFIHDDYDALLISKAPEMLEELNETVIDLKILKNQISDALKTNHLFEGMPELIDRWINRKTKLIKEATELN